VSPLIQQRLATLTATLLAHPASEVRMATLQWRGEHPLTDHEHVLFTRLLTLLNSPFPEECESAAQTVFETYTGNNALLVGEAFQSILSNRRALSLACAAFSAVLLYQTSHLLSTTRAILAALAADHLTITLRVELIIKGLPWEEIAPEIVKLVDKLHVGALEKAKQTIHDVSSYPDARLFDLETTLAANHDERLRWLALAALVAQSKLISGWSDEAIARLEHYRNDPSPLVAEAAQFTFVP
jgi:hypothetical protein